MAKMDECRRMIGVFGWREAELAALRILDTQWDRPFDPVDPMMFSDDALAIDGYRELKQNGWIGLDGVPSRAFWQRVHGR